MKQLKLPDSPISYYVSDNGHKRWCLFIHAAFVNHKMFEPQIEYFKDKYNILAVDIIGHGQSKAVKKGDSIDRMSLWINDIMISEGIEKINIIGVSLGAILAQDFANKYPDSVESLACFGGYDINNFDKKMQKENGATQRLMMLKALISVKWFAKANRKIAAYTLAAQNDFYRMNLAFPKKSFMYLASLNSMVNAHKTEPRCYPLMIGCGKFDIPAELASVEMWKSREPMAKVVIFENAGHCVNMDVPEEFNRVMGEFFDIIK